MAGAERAKGWLDTLLSITREGGPVSLLLVIVLGGITIYGLVGEVRRVHTLNRELVDNLLAQQEQGLELALRCERPAGEGR